VAAHLPVGAVWGQTVNAYVSGELAESKCLRQVVLLDLSILNFSIALGKSGGPSCNRPAKHRSRSHDAVIRVYDNAGSVINIPNGV